MRYDEPPVRWRTIAVVPVLLALIAGTVLIRPSGSAAKLKITTPVLSAVSSGSSFIDVQVCAPAGGTGLPAGFSVQWMKQADFDVSGWPANSDDPSNPSSFCKASFSGNAFNSNYNLAAGQCITVRIGELLLDNGASTNCPVPLECNTDYVFRAFGHATNSLFRSDFTADLSASTTSCSPPPSCTYTQGYWKNHGPVGCANGNNTDAWPTFTTITLGNVAYTDAQLCAILNTNAGTGQNQNGLIILAHQLIAAKLNLLNGTSNSCIQTTINAADALIGNLVVGSDSLPSSSTSALTQVLDDYNNGRLNCAGHCGNETGN